MTGLVRKATLFAVCGLLAASAAMASVPSPANSTCPIPACIYLVGDDGIGNIDPVGTFCLTVRDLANQPINNSLVVVDFSACSGLVLCDNNDPGYTVNCSNQTVAGFTTTGGVVCFKIKGHGTNVLGNQPPYNPYGCAKIFADGVLLCDNLSVSVFDQDGGGLGGPDLSAWLADFFGGLDPSRSDYDCSGPPLAGSDLSIWLTTFFAGGSTSNCPNAPKGQCSPIP